jgi:flagellar capping protein FliD
VESLNKYLESREKQLSDGFIKMEEMQSSMDGQMQALQNSFPKKN